MKSNPVFASLDLKAHWTVVVVRDDDPVLGHCPCHSLSHRPVHRGLTRLGAKDVNMECQSLPLLRGPTLMRIHAEVPMVEVESIVDVGQQGFGVIASGPKRHIIVSCP